MLKLPILTGFHFAARRARGLLAACIRNTKSRETSAQQARRMKAEEYKQETHSVVKPKYSSQ